MAATATSNWVPLEVYLRSSYEPDAEYVDGEIEERAVGEYDHSSWQEAIILWFRQHASEWNVRVKPELRVQVSRSRFRIPDVTVLDRALPIEQIITHPPLAVFEVLSPEDSMTRVLRKLEDYAKMGIPEIWVIDPKTRQARVYRDGALVPATVFGEPGGRMHFEIKEIEALLD
ncbi:Uma2 family endonuclease [Silvibacterium sp.]|uniref:Uma2 family endonuclease n=1 Tax=Silvibacterium sp. TaxID=1964179 RepID=UPI0039E28A46